MANTNSVRYAVVKETVAGVTPATPAFQRFAQKPGDNVQVTSETVTSPIIMNSGAGGGIEKVGRSVTSSLSTHLQRAASTDALIESAFGNAFSGASVKAGLTPQSVTVEKTFVEGGTTYYAEHRGVQVSKMTVSAEAKGIADVQFDLVGMTVSKGTTPITGSTYANVPATKRLNGLDVSVTVAGLTARYTKLSFSIESDRSAQHAFGSQDAVGIFTNGPRTTSLSLTLYRSDWSPEALASGVAVSFTIGSGVNGYKFDLHSATNEEPQDEEDGGAMYVTLNFVAAEDTVTALTDVTCTKLA
jgi:hypothetical protein